MKRVIEVTNLEFGCIYFPDEQTRNEYWEKKSEEEKEKYNHFRFIEAPKILVELENKLKLYELDRPPAQQI